jgi:hypothetical protein
MPALFPISDRRCWYVFIVWKNGIFRVVPTFLSLIFLILFQVPFLLFLSLFELPSPLLFGEFLVFQLCLIILR